MEFLNTFFEEHSWLLVTAVIFALLILLRWALPVILLALTAVGVMIMLVFATIADGTLRVYRWAKSLF